METRKNENAGGVAAAGRVRLVLVGCGKSKSAEVCAARDLYTGNLFRAARGYAEAEVQDGRATAWFVLSAKHGLLDPTAEVAPYDDRLAAGGARAALWGEAVLDALSARFPGVELELVVLAGAPYVRPLRAELRGWMLADPIHGLEVGERLSWLKAQKAARVPNIDRIQTEVDAWLLPRLARAKQRQVAHVTDARRRRAAKRLEAASTVHVGPAAPVEKTCPRCGRPAKGGPWGGDHCNDHACMSREHAETPAYLRRGDVSLTTRAPGRFSAAVWVYLPSGRQFVIKSDTVGRLVGPARQRYIEAAIGYRRKTELEAEVEVDHTAALDEDRERARALASPDVGAAARAEGFSAQDAESLTYHADELQAAHEAALLEDECRRGRPELSLPCPACRAAAGARCTDYRGKRKPSCRARREAAPSAAAARPAASSSVRRSTDDAVGAFRELRARVAAGESFTWTERRCSVCGSGPQGVAGQPLTCGRQECLDSATPADEECFWMGPGNRWGSYAWAFRPAASTSTRATAPVVTVGSTGGVQLALFPLAAA